ncbi:MAG TPA: glucose-6-phosphate dehydrogenase [Drouetiella sp.]
MSNGTEHKSKADAFVFFGASGDLAYKQIFPALQSMVRHGKLDIPVIGVAKSNWNLDQLKARARESCEKQPKFDEAVFEKLSSLLQYIDGDYADDTTFSALREQLGKAERPIYYLAIPPNFFSTVIDKLAKADCLRGARVVVEKPFGRDLATAKQLNKTLRKHLDEHAIYRIDHYLGKETVQNLIYFRFANPIVDAAWSNKYIESVEVTMAEVFDVADRGKLYDEEGAIRDVVQNHMLQVISCLAMECPSSRAHKSILDERTRVLKHVKPLSPDDIVRGQFVGYHDTKGVAPESTVETFAALKFEIANRRWEGVPFYVRVGKCLPVTITEVMVNFKPTENEILNESQSGDEGYYRFRLSPKEEIGQGIKIKKPGEAMTGSIGELVIQPNEQDQMPPYERLLGDAINGDSTLFSREDAVEAAWRVVDPIIGDATPVYKYDKGTWGPSEVEEKVKPKFGWHNPK